MLFAKLTLPPSISEYPSFLFFFFGGGGGRRGAGEWSGRGHVPAKVNYLELHLARCPESPIMLSSLTATRWSPTPIRPSSPTAPPLKTDLTTQPQPSSSPFKVRPGRRKKEELQKRKSTRSSPSETKFPVEVIKRVTVFTNEIVHTLEILKEKACE